MNVELLGSLEPDSAVPEWYASQPVEVPLLREAVRFILEEGDANGAPDDFIAAIHRFLGLLPAGRDAAAVHVFQNYRDSVERSGWHSGVVIADPREVWEHVRPTEVHVSRRRRDQRVYVCVMAECSWDPEHGLQLIFRDGDTLSRVSDQDGHLAYSDAYALPEAEDRIS